MQLARLSAAISDHTRLLLAPLLTHKAAERTVSSSGVIETRLAATNLAVRLATIPGEGTQAAKPTKNFAGGRTAHAGSRIELSGLYASLRSNWTDDFEREGN